MKKVTVELNEREMTVLKSVLNENEVGGEIKSDKHFIGKVIYFIRLLFYFTIVLAIIFFGLLVFVKNIGVVVILFWLGVALELVLKRISKILDK